MVIDVVASAAAAMVGRAGRKEGSDEMQSARLPSPARRSEKWRMRGESTVTLPCRFQVQIVALRLLPLSFAAREQPGARLCSTVNDIAEYTHVKPAESLRWRGGQRGVIAKSSLPRLPAAVEDDCLGGLVADVIEVVLVPA